jgi:hypothetical protein
MQNNLILSTPPTRQTTPAALQFFSVTDSGVEGVTGVVELGLEDTVEVRVAAVDGKINFALDVKTKTYRIRQYQS